MVAPWSFQQANSSDGSSHPFNIFVAIYVVPHICILLVRMADSERSRPARDEREVAVSFFIILWGATIIMVSKAAVSIQANFVGGCR